MNVKCEVDVENESVQSAIDGDESSVIFISDDSVSDVESFVENENSNLEVEGHQEIELTKNDIQMITETTITTETITAVAETVLKFDKATQTYENEFPAKPTNRPGTSALCNIVPSQASTSNNQSNGPNVSAINNKKNTAVDPAKKSSSSNAVNSSAINPSRKSSNLNAVNRNDQSDKNNSASTSKNTSNYNNSQNSVRRTWTRSKTYQNYRVQPYQRQHYNNVWNNPPQNYYSGGQDNYNRYGGRTQNNYYNNNSFDRQPYNNFYQPQSWQVQNYTYQFKERLFTGFIRFMDFVFQYDYTRDTWY